MRAASTAATDQHTACWRNPLREHDAPLRLEQLRIAQPAHAIRRIENHRRATTAPNNDPRPTSSTPATIVAPAAHARFS